MAVSIIDGTIDAVDVKTSTAKITIYNSIRFTLADGSSRTLTKSIVGNPVAEVLHPGASGRFYCFTALDIKGVHGFRAASGASYYSYPGGNNAKVFLVVGLVNLAILILIPLIVGGVPLLALGLVILGAVGYFFMRKGESEAKAQFLADGGYAPAPVAAVTQPV